MHFLYPGGHVQSLEFHLPHSPDAPTIARRILEEQIDWPAADDRRDDLFLLTSELVTNAVRHGIPLPDGTIGLLLEVSEDGVRVAVTDEGDYLAPDELAFETETDGRFGLVLADRRSDGWGFSLDGVKGVWFEVRRHGG
jgi:anti-sigma regulatory factor (Ser/Thr protein kinase)